MNHLEKQNIIDETSSIVMQIFEAANSKQYLRGLDHYSDDADACFVSDGIIRTLAELKPIYVSAGEAVEDLHNDILAWNVNVLSHALVSFTLPVKLRIKFKGIPEYTGQIIWSAILQRKSDEWLVIQSHESWLNIAEVSRALRME